MGGKEGGTERVTEGGREGASECACRGWREGGREDESQTGRGVGLRLP